MGGSQTIDWEDLGELWAIASMPGAALLGTRSRARKHPYDVLEVARRHGAIERRLYPEQVIVSTRARGMSFERSSAFGFRRLFDYATGANRSLRRGGRLGEQDAPCEAIDIEGTPLLHRAGPLDEWEIGVALPPRYGLATAPEPTDAQLEVRVVPPHQALALRFTGRASEVRFLKKLNVLKRWARDRGYLIDGAPRFASYDPPYTLPPCRRNEVLLTLGTIF